MINNDNLIDGLIMVVINEETPRHMATDFWIRMIINLMLMID